MIIIAYVFQSMMLKKKKTKNTNMGFFFEDTICNLHIERNESMML